MPETLAVAGLVLIGGSMWFHWRRSRQLKQRLEVDREPRTIRSAPTHPSVSLIVPIKGLDFGIAENIRALLRLAYPGWFELLFVFDDASDPAVPAVEQAITTDRQPHSPATRLLFCGKPPPGRTGKLHAMITGFDQARGRLIAFSDSDVRPGPDALTALVDSLQQDGQSGSAFAPVVVTEPPVTLGDVGYALLLNGLYGPEAVASTTRNDGNLPFIMGQFMVLRRQALRAIGGLQIADGQLVDDMYLGMRLHRAGYANRVSPQSVAIIQQHMSLAEFARTYVRWIAFSRTGLPGRTFKLGAMIRAGLVWAGLGLAATSLAWSADMGLFLGLGTLAWSSWSIARLHRRLGGADLGTRGLWAPALLILAAPFVLATILFRREVTWRGRPYRLDASSRLQGGV